MLPNRALFLQGALSALAAAVTPSPSPSTQPARPANPWDRCLQSDALPYDRPLELKMRVLDGPDFDLMQYRGNPTVLHMFATWCEPCAIEMPHIVQLASAYAARGLRVIGVDFAEADDTVRAYRKKYGITFPIAMDEQGGFTRALQGADSGRIELPASLYISAKGYLHCYTRGTTKHPGAELTYRIEKFLKEASA